MGIEVIVKFCLKNRENYGKGKFLEAERCLGVRGEPVDAWNCGRENGEKKG